MGQVIVNPEGIKTGDYFYTNTVVKLFRDSDIDSDLARLKKISTGVVSYELIPEILRVHKKLVDLLATEVKQKDRSFASKYLHFHFKDLFFIYDSRAYKALAAYVARPPRQYRDLIDRKNHDLYYARFFCRCHALQQLLKEHNSDVAEKITPRVVDNFLIRPQ